MKETMKLGVHLYAAHTEVKIHVPTTFDELTVNAVKSDGQESQPRRQGFIGNSFHKRSNSETQIAISRNSHRTEGFFKEITVNSEVVVIVGP